METFEAPGRQGPAQYERGLITDEERRQELIEIWKPATSDVARRHAEGGFPKTNPVWMMVQSGARGNLMQVPADLRYPQYHVANQG